MKQRRERMYGKIVCVTERCYLLGIVPGKASVDIDREGGGEVNGGDAETRRERLESPVPDLTSYSHTGSAGSPGQLRGKNLDPSPV